MEHRFDGDCPALRLARLRLEISCVDARITAARRRERRELAGPLTVPRIPNLAGPRERPWLN